MKFTVSFSDSAIDDLNYYRKSDRQKIVDEITLHLTYDADIHTKRRKRLRPNRIARWELRIEKFRVFYNFDDYDSVSVIAVGHKVHNELFIRGRKVEL